MRFSFRWGEADPRFDLNRNRNEGNHFGWVVEIDPFDPGLGAGQAHGAGPLLA